MDTEQQVRDFIEKVKALDSRPIADFTQKDVQQAWEIWGKLAEAIQGGVTRPPNLMQGRRWAQRLEQLEAKIVRF